jgi:hypothetical protein
MLPKTTGQKNGPIPVNIWKNCIQKNRIPKFRLLWRFSAREFEEKNTGSYVEFTIFLGIVDGISKCCKLRS